ncbi:MAG: hypothetical protein WCP60_11135 [bacterium]
MTRWDPRSNQVERWSATALLWVERGFRKIKGFEDLPYLLSALARPASHWAHAASSVPASSLRLRSCFAGDGLHSTGGVELHLHLDITPSSPNHPTTIRHF